MVVILKMDPRCADLAHTGVNFRDFGPHWENGPQMRRLVAWRALPLRCGGVPENGPRLGVVAVEFWTPDVTFCHHPSEPASITPKELTQHQTVSIP